MLLAKTFVASYVAFGLQVCGDVKKRSSSQLETRGITLKAFGSLPLLYVFMTIPSFLYVAMTFGSSYSIPCSVAFFSAAAASISSPSWKSPADNFYKMRSARLLPSLTFAGRFDSAWNLSRIV